MKRYLFSNKFWREFEKLSSEEKGLAFNKLYLLADQATHPSLRTKRLQGVGELFESSVNMDIRLLWEYEGDGIISVLHIGHHDILKMF